MIKKITSNNYYICIAALCLMYSFVFCNAEKKHMKILMVVPSFPKIHDVCMLNEIIGLIDRGHDVFINAHKLGDTVNIQQEVRTYNLLSKTIIGDLPHNLNEYDIVVFQLGHKAIDIKKTHNYTGKVVVRLRGYDITGFIQKDPHAYDGLFESCDLFMPVCEYFKNIAERLGCPSHKIVVHYSGIDCGRFTFKSRSYPEYGPINIVSVGRFVEKKGFIHSLYAIAQLVKKYPRIRYTIIGDGILKHKYEKYIKRAGIGAYVSLDGWHPHDEYIKILDNAHIFILSSVTAADNDQEGIPNVLKEAMATGLIAVATNHSGNAELVEDTISGFLVPERNSTAIIRSVDYILNNPDEWFSMQSIARNFVSKKFDMEVLNDSLEKIFLELIRD